MGSNSRDPRIVHFGDCVLDLDTAELRRNGTKTLLQTQPFQILTALLENPGQLVTREELTKRLWPTGTFVDFDQSLNKAVARLREALRDNPEQPIFIETLPRRGYRFVGVVQKTETDEPALDDDDKEVKRGRKNSLWAGVGAVLIVCVGLVFWRTVRQHGDSPMPSLEVVPLVALHGGQATPAFSPDGNQVAFGEYEGDNGAIYTSLIGSDKPLRLTLKPGACCPTWSPDGRQIAFMRFLEDRFSINVISALGGVEKTLYTNGPGGVRGMCAHLDWSPNGKWIAFGQVETLHHSRIALLSLDDLSVRALTFPADQEFDCEPSFSPDSFKVAFERGSSGGFGKDLFVMPAAGGDPRRLTFDNAWGGAPTWTEDGAEIVFSSMRGGPMNLWRISAKGGKPQPVAGISAIAYRPTIPRKGNLLAYEHGSVSSSIWQIRLRDRTHPAGPAVRLITSRGMINWRPNFSADGKKIVFESDRLGYSDIWYCDSDGSNCMQLTSLHGTAGTARWSPDEHHVVFEFQSQHYYEIYVIDVPDGRPRLLATFPNSDSGAPNWSRDGKWIYFYSTHEHGIFQLWKVPFQGGTPVRVTTNGGVYGTESEDGRYLYYSKIDQSGIWRMPFVGEKEERVLDQPPGYRWSNWVLSPSGIYFLSESGVAKGKIEFFDFASHKRIQIADVEKGINGLALAPDGKSLVYGQVDSEDYEIMLVKNFR
jgi:Tol biopolymer transport system component/DNA-binding winged helix-turn-helix (wHTH) protein